MTADAQGVSLQLLLARANGHAEALADGLDEEAAGKAPPVRPLARGALLGDPGGDPNDLPAQRWGVVAPEGARGDALLGRIGGLITARKAAQGGAEPMVLRAPPELTGRRARGWRDAVYLRESLPEKERPRYLLMLGDLDEISLELQQLLAAEAKVGRLAFSDDAGYEAYADKAVQREGGAGGARRLAFFTAREGSRAVETGYSALMGPASERARDGGEAGALAAEDIVSEAMSGQGALGRLLELAGGGEATVLFSLSHGLGAPEAGWAESALQRRRQGSLVLGPGAGDLLTAEEIAARPFLPGGAWLCYACFGAGTPRRSVYRKWLQLLRDEGATRQDPTSVLDSLPGPDEPPFVGALPQAALANPAGPLAVIGHVDLAWVHGFRDRRRQARPSRFLRVLRALVEGRRAGVALDTLQTTMSQLDTELALLGASRAYDDADDEPDDEPFDARTYGRLWMQRQDLAGYVLLGDPAVTVG